MAIREPVDVIQRLQREQRRSCTDSGDLQPRRRALQQRRAGSGGCGDAAIAATASHSATAVEVREAAVIRLGGDGAAVLSTFRRRSARCVHASRRTAMAAFQWKYDDARLGFPNSWD